MFCKYCGKETESEVCDECKNKENNETIEVEATKVETNNTTSSTTKPKSKIAAGLLGIFLGSLGVHNFYLGYTGKAIAQLLISILSCGALAVVSEIWGLVEGILILTGSIDTDANGVKLGD